VNVRPVWDGNSPWRGAFVHPLWPLGHHASRSHPRHGGSLPGSTECVEVLALHPWGAHPSPACPPCAVVQASLVPPGCSRHRENYLGPWARRLRERGLDAGTRQSVAPVHMHTHIHIRTATGEGSARSRPSGPVWAPISKAGRRSYAIPLHSARSCVTHGSFAREYVSDAMCAAPGSGKRAAAASRRAPPLRRPRGEGPSPSRRLAQGSRGELMASYAASSSIGGHVLPRQGRPATERCPKQAPQPAVRVGRSGSVSAATFGGRKWSGRGPEKWPYNSCYTDSPSRSPSRGAPLDRRARSWPGAETSWLGELGC